MKTNFMVGSGVTTILISIGILLYTHSSGNFRGWTFGVLLGILSTLIGLIIENT